MSWQLEIDELRKREKLAYEMGGKESVERHRSRGKLDVRERIRRLLDEDSFHESGTISGKATYENDEIKSFTPANFLIGTGRVNGRKVVVGADDFTVRGGAADGAVRGKQPYSEKMAH